MNSWCKKTFKKNGLIELIKESKVTEKQVDNEVSYYKVLFDVIGRK